MGHPVKLHLAKANITNLEVTKVLTIVDPRKPLTEAVNAQFETGDIYQILVSYLWLPPICDFCKEVGHSIRRCPTALITCQGCNSTSHVWSDCVLW